jgi:AcrR family transcriptional regulator
VSEQRGSPSNPTLSRKERRHHDARQEIFAAARQLLLEVDPDELSLRQVAHRAGFSPASLYTYFSSRDELIEALRADAVKRLCTYLPGYPGTCPPTGGWSLSAWPT